MALPCEENSGQFSRESDRLSYWLAGLVCGALEPEEVSEELDRLVLEREETVPVWLADAAWAAVQGVNPLIAACGRACGSGGLNPTPPCARRPAGGYRRSSGTSGDPAAGTWSGPSAA